MIHALPGFADTAYSDSVFGAYQSILIRTTFNTFPDTAYAEVPASTTPHIPLASLWVVLALALVWAMVYGRRR